VFISKLYHSSKNFAAFQIVHLKISTVTYHHVVINVCDFLSFEEQHTYGKKKEKKKKVKKNNNGQSGQRKIS